MLNFTITMLALTVMFNSAMVYRAVKYQRKVLIPPTMTGTVEFIQGKPNDAYIADISRRIVGLAATYSPPTARSQFEESQVSSVFYLEKINLTEGVIEVFGNFKQYAGDTLLENTSKTYLIDYRLQDCRFYVVSFKEKLTQKQEQECG